MEHENHPTFAAGPRCPGRKFEPPDTIAPHRPSATTTTTIRTTSRYMITKIINPSIPNAPSLFLRAGSKPITIPLQNEHASRHKCMPDPPPPHRLRRLPANPSRPANTSPQITLTPSLMRMVSCSFSASSDMFGLWFDLGWLGIQNSGGWTAGPPAVLRREPAGQKREQAAAITSSKREKRAQFGPTGEALPEQQANWQAVAATCKLLSLPFFSRKGVAIVYAVPCSGYYDCSTYSIRLCRDLDRL